MILKFESIGRRVENLRFDWQIIISIRLHGQHANAGTGARSSS